MSISGRPKRIYDLSVPVRDGVDWYGEPDSPQVNLREVGSLADEGWVSHVLSLMVLNGTTYLETAAHIYADAPTLDQMPPERFLTRAFVVHLVPDGQVIPAPGDPLMDFEMGADAILLHCGWEDHVHAEDYYHASPYFSPELQQWLLDHEPAILGGDMLSFDHPEDTSMPFIRAFFRTGGMILCPLMGLAELPCDLVTLCAAPTRLTSANAAPCRALAWCDEQ